MDGVAAEKPATRASVVAALAVVRSCKGYVRVNGIGTQWRLGDLMDIVRPGVDGTVLPKAESAADLRIADWVIANLERERGLSVGGIDLMPIIESAGLAAIQVDGVFVDYPIFYRAQRILATFAAIRDRGAEQGGAGAN